MEMPMEIELYRQKYQITKVGALWYIHGRKKSDDGEWWRGL